MRRIRFGYVMGLSRFFRVKRLRPATTCQECGQHYVVTPSGYFACPKGHGRLIPKPAMVEMIEAINGSR